MIEGLDLLAGARYKKEVTNFAQTHCIGLFAETFGNALPVAEKALRKGCKFLRIQLLWSDSHALGDKDIPKI